MRTQFHGNGGRELTLLSGVPGELPRGGAIGQATVRGHNTSLSSPSAGIVVARWLEAPEGNACAQAAITASKLSAAELDAVLVGIH